MRLEHNVGIKENTYNYFGPAVAEKQRAFTHTSRREIFCEERY